MRDDGVALAKVRLEDILSFFGINTKVKANDQGDTVELLVDTDSGGRLIGHRGETLRALQHLINMIVRNHHHDDERLYISIDIAGYKRARAETLTARAQESARLVVETGQDKTLEPMTASERRVVHMELAELPEVETESIGAEPRRRIVIKKRA